MRRCEHGCALPQSLLALGGWQLVAWWARISVHSIGAVNGVLNTTHNQQRTDDSPTPPLLCVHLTIPAPLAFCSQSCVFTVVCLCGSAESRTMWLSNAVCTELEWDIKLRVRADVTIYFTVCV